MEYIIKKISELQERLNTLIDESIILLCELKGINPDKKIIELSPLEFELYLCNDFFNDETTMFDPDASLVAWKYYKNYYKGLFDFPEISEKPKSLWTSGNEYKRYCITFDYNNYNSSNKKLSVSNTTRLKSGINIGISGDCCFNFNELKIRKFTRILSDIKQEKEYSQIKNLVLQCYKMHHSPFNFALMPKNGGTVHSFNNKKSNIFDRNDRLDSFLCYLEKDFNNNERPKPLKEFLKAIGSFENYRGLFYPEIHENEELKKKITETGDKKIEDCNSLLAYIDTAINFWDAKLKYYKKKNLPKDFNKISLESLITFKAFVINTILSLHTMFVEMWGATSRGSRLWWGGCGRLGRVCVGSW